MTVPTSFRITGLMAAPFAPFAADGTLAPERVSAYAARLKADGVHGVFVNGTTGEGQSLSDDERRCLADAWIREQTAEFPVVIHVGHTALPLACALAAHAQRSGAAAIAAIAPYFFKPGMDALIEWLAALSAAAPALPLYHYHMPSMSGSTVRMAEFLPAAAKRVPTLTGVKFTHEDLFDFRCATEVCERKFDVVFGRDEILIAGLALGAQGAVGSTYNYAAPLYRRLWQAFAAGDMETARMWQDRAQEMIGILQAHGGGVTVGKALMALRGLDMGPSRLPLQTAVLAPEVAKQLLTLCTVSEQSATAR